MRLFVQGAVLLLGMGFLSAPAKAQKVVIEDDAPNSIVLACQRRVLYQYRTHLKTLIQQEPNLTRFRDTYATSY